MATIALRVPTTTLRGNVIKGGHCYIVFPEPTITVGELIAEKVRAELRKARAGGPHTSSLDYLVAPGATIGHGPLDEQLAIKSATTSYLAGQYLIQIGDSTLLGSTDATIELTRRIDIRFVITAPLPVDVVNPGPQQLHPSAIDAIREAKQPEFIWTATFDNRTGDYAIVSVSTSKDSVIIMGHAASIEEGKAFFESMASQDICVWKEQK